MNIEAVNDAHALFKNGGYNGTIEDFQSLIATNEEALSDANSYEITVEGKTYTIPKAIKDPTTTPPLIQQGGQANPQEVENAIQQVIDDYYGGLAMDTPDEQMQETDVMESDLTKYNVA